MAGQGDRGDPGYQEIIFSMSANLSVAIVQCVVPFYRKAVFQSLVDARNVNIRLYASQASDNGLKLLDSDEFRAIGAVDSPLWRLPLRGDTAITFQPSACLRVMKMRPDCVVVQGGPYELTSWILLLWGRLTGTPVLAWTLGVQRREAGLKWWFRKSFFGLARGLLLYGDYPAKLLVEGGVPADSIHVIYNSLDTSAQQVAFKQIEATDTDGIRSQYGLSANASVFVFIGRVVARKRLSVAIEAIGILRDKGVDAHFMVIGDGDDVSALKQLSIQKDVRERVHFVGSVYEEPKIASYMALAQGAIIPEAGLPIIHPMAYAVVPIISDNIEQHGTEWEAVEEGSTGHFFRDGDADHLASVLEACIANPEREKLIGQAAQERALDRYSASSHSLRMIEGIRKFAN